MDIVSTNVANTIPTNVTNTVPTNFYKKVRYKINFLNSAYNFVSHHITIDNCYYLLLLCKT